MPSLNCGYLKSTGMIMKASERKVSSARCVFWGRSAGIEPAVFNQAYVLEEEEEGKMQPSCLS